ncbi:MAG: hypothetical protein NTW31_02735 [Bacteroidetes bacterium]|nr:hypothetical protein [Bacteroidota bacterium]
MGKTIIAVLLMTFIVINCHAQDVITKNTGDSILAKVLEVTSTEIKFKKADNLSGPTYSVLKSEIFMIRYANGSSEIITKLEPKQFEGNMGKVCFLRKNGYSGSGIAFLVAIDDSVVCKLKSNCYSEHFISPGEHRVSLTGNKFTISNPITITVSPGRITYVQLTTKTNFTTFDILIEKVSENLAKLIIPEIKPSKKCQ